LLTLCFEQTAGTYGVVSVDWYIDMAKTTAFRGRDFIADGATLTFAEDESLKGKLNCSSIFTPVTVESRKDLFHN
jgi:hypothetical protein